MKDRIILQKIDNYLQRIDTAYHRIKDMDDATLLETETSYALTQYLTNVHSLFQNLTNDEVSGKLFGCGIRSLNTCRNISAHDYDALDWIKVKQLCRRLLSPQTATVIAECYEIIAQDEAREIDYTKNS